MPSIEHNGESWIRLVDHIYLTSKEKEEAVQKERERIQSIADHLIPIQNQKEHNNAVLKLNNIITPTDTV